MKPVTCQDFFLIFVAISKKYENVLCSSTKLVTLLILLLIHKRLCAIMKRETGGIKNGEKKCNLCRYCSIYRFFQNNDFPHLPDIVTQERVRMFILHYAITITFPTSAVSGMKTFVSFLSLPKHDILRQDSCTGL